MPKIKFRSKDGTIRSVEGIIEDEDFECIYVRITKGKIRNKRKRAIRIPINAIIEEEE
jgi:hypothetical protein